jgi:hypothetical protein
LIFPRRIAETHDSRTGKKTHETEFVKRGIVFPKVVPETRRVDT